MAQYRRYSRRGRWVHRRLVGFVHIEPPLGVRFDATAYKFAVALHCSFCDWFNSQYEYGECLGELFGMVVFHRTIERNLDRTHKQFHAKPVLDIQRMQLSPLGTFTFYIHWRVKWKGKEKDLYGLILQKVYLS